MCCRFNPEGGLLAVGLVNGVTKVKQLGFFGITDFIVLILCGRPLNFLTIFASVNIIAAYINKSHLCMQILQPFVFCFFCAGKVNLKFCDLQLIFFLFQVYAPDTGHCVYSLSDQDTFNSSLPVTCLRWKPTSEGDSYGNVLLATCKLVSRAV